MDSGPKSIRQKGDSVDKWSTQREDTGVSQVNDADPILNLPFDEAVLYYKLEKIT